MVNNKFKIVLLLFIYCCSNNNIQVDEDFSIRFKKAIKYFNKGKFNRAKDEFNYIVMTDPGSKIANESQYYIGESMFQLEEYLEASNIFDRYVRFSPDFSKVEEVRFRICECAIKLSNSYQRDQSQTYNSLEQLQMFIEDFPKSKYIDKAEEYILLMRIKLAEKDYQSGRLYLKLEEYDAALLYFQSVLNEFYDTSLSDDARIGIIFTHILNKNKKGARRYLNSQQGRFLSNKKYLEAESLLNNTDSRLKLTQYYQLYK